MTKEGDIWRQWEKIKPRCDFCELPAGYIAGQSEDQGKTVNWKLVCFNHMAGWNKGGDWESPVFEIGHRLRPWNGPGSTRRKR